MTKNYRDASTGRYTTAADAAARPAETVSESVPTRHEAPDVAELRRLAEAATRGATLRRYDHGGGRLAIFDGEHRQLVADFYDEANREFYAAASPDVVLGLTDRLAHMTEARDNARAEVERLTALVAEVRETAEHYYGQAYADGSAAVLRILGLDAPDGAES